MALACGLIVVACAGVGVFRAVSGSGGVEVVRAAPVPDAAYVEDAAIEAEEPEDVAVSVVVHVDGAVVAPGVYSVTAEVPRVADVVELAGGLASDADTSSVNLAAPLSDGQKVHIPHEGEVAAVASAGSAAGGGSVSSGLININLASEQELQALPGVGEATAQAIVEERERGGPFGSPEDLMRVSGIGEKKFERVRSLICV